MVTKRRCPHTGIVNFFIKADLLLAVGSVQEAGVAADISLAEAHLRNAIARGRDLRPGLM